MILWNFDIVKLRCVQVGEFCLDVLPFFRWRLLCITILSRTIRAFFIKYRFRRIELDQFWFTSLFFLTCFGLEFIGPKPTVITTNFRPIFGIKIIGIIPKIVLQFFFEALLRKWIRNLCIFTVGFIHLPCGFQCCSIFLQENMVRINHEVVEIIGRAHHRQGNIIVIPIRVTQIYLSTTICNRAKFKTYLLHKCFILFRIQLVTGWTHVN